MGLPPQKLKLIHDSFKEVFVEKSSLELLLALSLGRVYADLSADGAREIEYFHILRQADAQGWIEKLVRAAAETHSESLAMQSALAIFGPDAASSTTALPPPANVSQEAEAIADSNDASVQQALQRIVRQGVPNPDALPLVNAMHIGPRRVGSIEFPEGNQQGTCFLVGPDLVLTNHHVVAAMSSIPGADINVRFDFARTAIAINNGFVVPLSQNWLLASRPHSAADTSIDDADVPGATELDYALLRLASRPGPAADGTPRGWFTVANVAKSPVVGANILIFNHPMTQPLKLTFGRVLAITGDARRVRYDANTKKGSSGSPVIGESGKLVGLHHAGDANFARLALFNQAVPIELIADDIASKGIELVSSP